MPNTTNFGWATPADTDLVKDGAAAIRTLGSSIDTSLVDLKGGTTGQVLTKASNTDLDFSFTTPTDQTPLTTKGDLFTFTTVDARIGVGANGTVLTADSAETTGLKWVAPAAAGGMTQLATGSMSGTTTTITSISGSYKNLELIIRDPANSTSDGTPAVRINGDTSGVYGSITFVSAGADVAATATSFGMGYHENVTDGIIKIVFTDYANTSTFKMIESRNFSKNTGTNIYGQANWGLARITSAITEINLIWTGGQTWNAGTYILYGVS